MEMEYNHLFNRVHHTLLCMYVNIRTLLRFTGIQIKLYTLDEIPEGSFSSDINKWYAPDEITRYMDANPYMLSKKLFIQACYGTRC